MKAQRRRCDRLLREGEVSALLNVSVGLLRKWRSDRRRGVRHLGPDWVAFSKKGVRYSLHAVETWLAQRALR